MTRVKKQNGSTSKTVLVASNLDTFIFFHLILIKFASDCTVCQGPASQIHSSPIFLFPLRSSNTEGTVNVLKFEHLIPYCFGLNIAFYAVVSEKT